MDCFFYACNFGDIAEYPRKFRYELRMAIENLIYLIISILMNIL